MNLKSKQKKQLGTLQKEVDEKLALLLTESQKKQFKDMGQQFGRRGSMADRTAAGAVVPDFGGPPDGPPGGDGPPEALPTKRCAMQPAGRREAGGDQSHGVGGFRSVSRRELAELARAEL